MNFLCHVNCCNNRGDIPGVTYHKFPKTVAELWFSVNNIPIRNVENACEMIVCSDHFKLEDFTDTDRGMQLKNGAVPSLYLKISKRGDSVLVSSANIGDKSCINNVPSKRGNVTVLQKNTDSAVVEKYRDKCLELTDIISITDSSDILSVITAMHNYSISVPKHVNTELQCQYFTHSEQDDLLKEKALVKKVPCFKNRHKVKNQKERVKRLPKKSKKVKNTAEDSAKMNEEEIIENVILDHDYTLPEDVEELQNLDNNAYSSISSESYVWKLKKQLGQYSKKTRQLRKRVDYLKSIVNVLKKRIF